MSDIPKNGDNNNRRIYDTEIIDDNGQSNGKGGNQAGFGIWTASGYSGYSGGCGPSFITFALFFACIIQFGLLAAIGFIVFYAIGSILGSIYNGRRIILGQPYNPWLWRFCNWCVSLFIVTMLAAK